MSQRARSNILFRILTDIDNLGAGSGPRVRLGEPSPWRWKITIDDVALDGGALLDFHAAYWALTGIRMTIAAQKDRSREVALS